MCDAPIGTTSWSPAKKRNGSKMLSYREAEGVASHMAAVDQDKKKRKPDKKNRKESRDAGIEERTDEDKMQ